MEIRDIKVGKATRSRYGRTIPPVGKVTLVNPRNGAAFAVRTYPSATLARMTKGAMVEVFGIPARGATIVLGDGELAAVFGRVKA